MRLVRAEKMGEKEDMWKENCGMDGGLKPVFQMRKWEENGGGLCALQEWDSLKLSSHRRLQQLK